METTSKQNSTPERRVRAASGWLILIFNLLLVFGTPLFIAFGALIMSHGGTPLPFGLCMLAELGGIVCLFGYFTLQPNEARILILFGAYKGTVRDSGFFWANPFYSRNRGRVRPKSAGPADRGERNKAAGTLAAFGLYESLSTKLSLRAHNFNSEKLKVNDKLGNPVEIAAVVVWRVENTAQAVFDVEDYNGYVHVQSESALRSIASRYAYDQGNEHETTLRGGADEVAHALKLELQARLAKAGVIVEEARLTHLAYAPEIAQVMLRRQQAEAVIAARQIIVRNAVGMVHMALEELEAKGAVSLDEERKAAMVSNLLVVLCGSNETTPVINTGTLYN
jgi:regulator of protease activity HflC (stomatin/prohibitin superfamily)